MTRLLTDHQINGYPPIRVEVLDEPGSGGACHEYAMIGAHFPQQLIRFQNGPVGEAGCNGTTEEALLAIVKDRLVGFQSGDFACPYNEVALNNVKLALGTLHGRTRDRTARGVEGKNEK